MLYRPWHHRLDRPLCVRPRAHFAPYQCRIQEVRTSAWRGRPVPAVGRMSRLKADRSARVPLRGAAGCGGIADSVLDFLFSANGGCRAPSMSWWTGLVDQVRCARGVGGRFRAGFGGLGHIAVCSPPGCAPGPWSHPPRWPVLNLEPIQKPLLGRSCVQTARVVRSPNCLTEHAPALRTAAEPDCAAMGVKGGPRVGERKRGNGCCGTCLEPRRIP